MGDGLAAQLRGAQHDDAIVVVQHDPTEDEIRAASLQFVRKLSGFSVPSKANEAAFEQAVAEVAATARQLIASLTTTAEPRNRETEAAKARARSAARFGSTAN